VQVDAEVMLAKLHRSNNVSMTTFGMLLASNDLIITTGAIEPAMKN
jgi:hypothetical protein